MEMTEEEEEKENVIFVWVIRSPINYKQLCVHLRWYNSISGHTSIFQHHINRGLWHVIMLLYCITWTSDSCDNPDKTNTTNDKNRDNKDDKIITVKT